RRTLSMMQRPQTPTLFPYTTLFRSNTHIVEGDTATQRAYERARKAYTDFRGSQANIDSARKYLDMRDQLTPLQAKQFDAILFAAGANPATAAEAVSQLITVQADQTKILYGFDFRIDNRSVTKNDINNILASDAALARKTKAWISRKEVGREDRKSTRLNSS